ncbi:MAG: hypothetical protein DRP89_02290 [Candidatus Neomarinimicrobiota bacterium]|nr:MAG: hypothetical protein DRP89_02290 [Candidatus Neomarinimicrobiota bacterium]
MNSRFKVIFLVGFALLPYLLFAEGLKVENSRHLLGVSYSGISGTGITYKYNLIRNTALELQDIYFTTKKVRMNQVKKRISSTILV